MHYYNENDTQLVAWLRNLIKAGLLPEGDVDDRSIADVKGTDLAGYTQCHFFAGIGGWPLALDLAGWPTTRPVWTGSCPCQPFSNAGRQGGTDDPRHLWPQLQRLIDECNPSVVFGEQVASKAGRAWLSGVRADLETLAYGVGASDLCGASIGSPHIRQRLYWVADAISQPVRAELGGVGGEEETEPSQGVQRQRSGSYPGHSSQTSRVGNPSIERLSVSGGEQATVGEPGPQSQSQRPSEGSVGMADAERSRLMDAEPHNGEHHAEGRPQRNTPHNERKPSKGRSHEGGVGDSIKQGLEGLTGASTGGNESRRVKEDTPRPTATPSTTITPWDGAVWLQCLDNKDRRIEPGVRPLADGVPGRVVKLRAYGNAIIPQVAAEFVTAFMDIEEGRLQ